FVKITGMNPEELEAAEAEAAGAAGGAAAGRPEPATATEDGRDTPQGLLERVESAGQDPGEREVLSPEVLKRAYYNQPVWKRVVVIAAGPTVNILIAFVLLFAVYLSLPEPKGIVVDKVQPGTPAAAALKPGDRLLSVEGIRANFPNVDKIKDVNDRLNATDDKFTHITHRIRKHTCPQGKVPG